MIMFQWACKAWGPHRKVDTKEASVVVICVEGCVAVDQAVYGELLHQLTGAVGTCKAPNYVSGIPGKEQYFERLSVSGDRRK